ncbi:MAG TPA: non-heme iron oxygenase ferredoxin subunit [Nocardioidaceae bacterium]|jgi:3-phenylpropionate/trans-cinnamate dioxygenase ferredoxin subunit|nr:non-heme iron oxygenase ferredoxin subunit [Nocardioidaceae bacterium]
MAAQRVCALADVGVDAALALDVDGVAVAVVRTPDEVFAIADQCSHAAIPLSEGDVEGCEIECWLHGSRFDLRTGKPLGLPATEPVPVYPCHVDAGGVFVDVASPLHTDTEH